MYLVNLTCFDFAKTCQMELIMIYTPNIWWNIQADDVKVSWTGISAGTFDMLCFRYRFSQWRATRSGMYSWDENQDFLALRTASWVCAVHPAMVRGRAAPDHRSRPGITGKNPFSGSIYRPGDQQTAGLLAGVVSVVLTGSGRDEDWRWSNSGRAAKAKGSPSFISIFLCEMTYYSNVNKSKFFMNYR